MFGPTLKLLQGYKGPLPLLTSLQNPKVTLGFNRTDFVRSGHLYLANSAGTLRGVGRNANYRSSRAYINNTSAYDLFFTDTVSSSINYNPRDFAFPLRCLSTVLNM